MEEAQTGSKRPSGTRKRRRRSRHRRGAAERAGRLGRLLTVVAEGAVIVSLFAAPLMIGSVPTWAVAMGLALAVVGFVAAAGGLRLRRGRLPAGGPVWLALAVLAFEALQLVPLPPGLLGLLSPRAHELLAFSLGDLGAFPAWRPLHLDPVQGAIELSRHLTFVLVLLTVLALSGRPHRLRRLAGALGLSVVAVVVLAFVHRLVGARLIYGLYPVPPQGWLFASFVNPNQLGGYLDLAAPVLLGLALAARDRSRGVLWGVAFVLAAATAVLSLSRGGIIGLLVGLTLFAVLWGRARAQRLSDEAGTSGAPPPDPWSRLRPVVLPLLVGAGLSVAGYLALDPILAEVQTLVDEERVAGDARWTLWGESMEMAGDFWATGVGRGAFAVVHPLYKATPYRVTFTHAENQLVQALVELGVAASALLLAAFLWIWLRALRRRALSAVEVGALAGLAGLAVHELADFGTTFGGLAVPAMVTLGLVWGRTRGSSGGGQPQSLPLTASVGLTAGALACAGLLAAGWGHRAGEDFETLTAAVEAGADVETAAAEVVRRHPTDAMPPLFAAGRLLEEGRDAAAALRWVNKAMFLAPSEPRAHLIAASLLQRTGRKDQALLELRLAAGWGMPREALGLAAAWYTEVDDLVLALPEGDEGRRQVVAHLTRANRCEEVWPLATPLRTAAPDDTELRGWLAGCALRLGRLDEVETLSREIAAAEPRDPSGPTWFARARIKAGDVAGATDALRDGLLRAPGDPGLSILLADHLLRRAKDPDGALDVLDAMRLPSGAGRVRMHMLQGSAHRARGRTRKALEAWRVAARVAPQDPGPLMAIGGLLAETGDLEGALGSYRDARRRRPSAHLDTLIGRLEAQKDDLERFRARERLYGDGDVDLPVPATGR